MELLFETDMDVYVLSTPQNIKYSVPPNRVDMIDEEKHGGEQVSETG